MPRLAIVAGLLVSLTAAVSASAQFAKVISDKRTIAIDATDKAVAEAEVATVKVVYQNQAATKDAAYDENVKASAKSIKALLDSNMPKSDISTETLSLTREEDLDAPRSLQPKLLRFASDQEWQIRVKASEAQKVVDIAVAAGANQVGQAEWSVADVAALEARAYATALHRAKAIAEATATQAGVTLAEILSISNTASTVEAGGGGAGRYRTIEVEAQAMVKKTPLTLFPPSIEREVTVSVVFAIGQ